MAAVTSDDRMGEVARPALLKVHVDVGGGLYGTVKLDVELFTPLDHSVEISDECSVFLFEGGDVLSSRATSDLVSFKGLNSCFSLS